MTFNQAYSNPERANIPHALPDLEVFHCDSQEAKHVTGSNRAGPGWYYWYCLPGCLPESDPIGPFNTHNEALEDAQEQ